MTTMSSRLERATRMILSQEVSLLGQDHKTTILVFSSNILKGLYVRRTTADLIALMWNTIIAAKTCFRPGIEVTRTTLTEFFVVLASRYDTTPDIPVDVMSFLGRYVHYFLKQPKTINAFVLYVEFAMTLGQLISKMEEENFSSHLEV